MIKFENVRFNKKGFIFVFDCLFFVKIIIVVILLIMVNNVVIEYRMMNIIVIFNGYVNGW